MKLDSGKSHRMTLKRGNCYEDGLRAMAKKAELEAIALKESMTSSTEIYPTFNITADVIELGKHILLERNETESVEVSTTTTMTSITESIITSNASWTPMLTSSNVTQPAANSSEVDDEKFLNLGERMPKKAKTEKRSFGMGNDDDDDVDLLSSSAVREDSSDDDEPNEDDAMGDESVDNKFVTVQLFQYRLGDVFEKAEKYARNTLFPLLSEQISNIFNFDSTERDLMSSTDSPIVIRSLSKSLRKYDQDEDVDVRSLQSMGLKFATENLKPIEKIIKTYEAMKEEHDRRKNAEKVRIELPTYRPTETSSEKVFIPIERNP